MSRLKVFRECLMTLYSLILILSYLDIITTKLALSSGGFEGSAGARWLFATFGFDVAAAIRLLSVAVMVTVSELMLWQLNKDRKEAPRRIMWAKRIMLLGWFFIAVTLCVVVLNNLWVLKEIGFIKV